MSPTAASGSIGALWYNRKNWLQTIYDFGLSLWTILKIQSSVSVCNALLLPNKNSGVAIPINVFKKINRNECKLKQKFVIFSTLESPFSSSFRSPSSSPQPPPFKAHHFSAPYSSRLIPHPATYFSFEFMLSWSLITLPSLLGYFLTFTKPTPFRTPFVWPFCRITFKILFGFPFQCLWLLVYFWSISLFHSVQKKIP